MSRLLDYTIHSHIMYSINNMNITEYVLSTASKFDWLTNLKNERQLKNKPLTINSRLTTVCPRSLAPFYIVRCNIKCVIQYHSCVTHLSELIKSYNRQ